MAWLCLTWDRNFSRLLFATMEIEPQAMSLWGKVYGANRWNKRAFEQYRKLFALWIEGDADNRLFIEVQKPYEQLERALTMNK